MCIPELIFLDDESRDRPSRLRRKAISPVPVNSNEPSPLLSSPPFVVQISPKIGHHHHHPSVRQQPIRQRSAPLPQRKLEDMGWREGFRAGREAAHKRDLEGKKGNNVEVKKDMAAESRPKATVPDTMGTNSRPRNATAEKPVSEKTVPSPANLEADATIQPQLQRAASEPQQVPVRQAPTSTSIPAPVPTPATALTASQPPPTTQKEARKLESQPQQDQPYVYEHRRSYRGPRRRSPSTDSTSSRSLRALKRRLSNIWAHVAGLERWAIDEDARERQARRDRAQRENDIRRAREKEAAEEARRRRRMGREVRFEGPGRRMRGGRALGPAPPRRLQQVVVIDERDRAPVDTWATSRWNWERGL